MDLTFVYTARGEDAPLQLLDIECWQARQTIKHGVKHCERDVKNVKHERSASPVTAWHKPSTYTRPIL